MADFWKKILKGVAAVTIAGPQGAMLLAARKGIKKRIENKKKKLTIDPVRASTNDLTDGDASHYRKLIVEKKNKARTLFGKIKKANVMMNQGKTRQAVVKELQISESELNEPTQYYL